MPRKTSDKEEQTPAVALRRSPRFLQIKLIDLQDPGTPKPRQRRRTRVLSSATPLTLMGKKDSPRRISHRSRSKECSEKPEESCNARQSSDDSKTRLRRSTRLNRCADEHNAEKPSRSSNRRTKFNTNEGVLSITEKPVLDKELSKNSVGKKTNGIAVTTAIVLHEAPMDGWDVKKTRKNVGVKRTRNQFEDIVGVTQGWTKDQESALERAYLEAKPTPHFWKKVSRLVPGKSAQECFDKIHGSHLTPPQPCGRSRPRVSNSQNPLFSASKLLNSTSPTDKKSRYRRQKHHVVQRTLRNMLQKQYKVEQDSESDMFSVLEPTFNQSLDCHLMLTTPERNQETDEALKRFQERSSTAHKRIRSRLRSSFGTTLVSPPVLKQVKNKALHEKYIDQLHRREASRKVSRAKAEKLHGSSSVKRKDAIKAAKNALVFDARDAINEFQSQQATALINCFDDESGFDGDEDNREVLL